MNQGPITLINELLKIIFMCFCTHVTFKRIINKQDDIKLKNIVLYFSLIILAIVVTFIKYKTNMITSRLVLVILFSVICTINYKISIKKTLLVSTIALSINYIVFFVAIVILYTINKVIVIRNDMYNLFAMMILHISVLYALNKIRRIRDGISYICEKTNNEMLNIIVFNISIIICFMFCCFSGMDTNKKVSTDFFVIFFIFSTIIFFTIKESIEAYYKQKLLIKDLEETKKELEEKNKEIEELEQENLSFSKRSHSLAHKQKSLEFKLNKLLMKSEYAEELGLNDEFKRISKDLIENEKLPKLDKTEIVEIDDMLNLMQEECRKNGIDFSLQIKGNIFQMTNNFIDKQDLAILLADHIKDAIIAINHTNTLNKSILVRLGKIDECFAVYIYDSGIEFPEEIFEELGKRPITTYPNEGGTGMGFMNTFDVLKKSNGSLIIENIGKPSNDNYTKVIKIKFDNRNKIMFDKTKIL